MDVIDDRPRSEYEFKQLRTGSVFEDDTSIYIKVSGSSDINAVHLSTGNTMKMHPDALVTVLDAAIHIN